MIIPPIFPMPRYLLGSKFPLQTAQHFSYLIYYKCKISVIQLNILKFMKI